MEIVKVPPKLAAALVAATKTVAEFVRQNGPLPMTGKANKGRRGEQTYVRAVDVEVLALGVLAQHELAIGWGNTIAWKDGAKKDQDIARVAVLCLDPTVMHASGEAVTFAREVVIGEDQHATETITRKY